MLVSNDFSFKGKVSWYKISSPLEILRIISDASVSIVPSTESIVKLFEISEVISNAPTRLDSVGTNSFQIFSTTKVVEINARLRYFPVTTYSPLIQCLSTMISSEKKPLEL